MEEKLKQKWIKALRSGKFRQAREVIADDDSYCCLGVLCIVAGKTVRDIIKSSNDDLCTAWRREFGLSNDETEQCIAWNDNDKLSFKEIAERISKMPTL